MRQHPIGSLQDRHLRAGACGDVREFGGDVAAAHHDDAGGKLLQFEKLVAGRQMLGTRKGKRHRARPGRDQHMTGLERLPCYLDRGRPGKPRGAA